MIEPAPEPFGPIRHRIVAIVTLLLVASSFISLRAQPAPAPVVRGAEYFSASALSDIIGNRPLDSARVALQTAYASEGFLDARVSVDSSRDLLVTEGRRYTIGSLRVAPDSIAAVVEASGYRPRDAVGGPFTTATLGEIGERMVRLMNERGFPLAAATVDGLDIDSATARVGVRFTLSTGERIVISRIDVRGNTQTRASLIVTAAAVPPNSIFTDELAAQVKARLVRLRLFSDVAEPQLFKTDSGGYGLLLGVTEGNTNSFDGIVGFQPKADSSGGGDLTGLVNVEFRNIFGTGRRAAFRWERQSPQESQLELRYGEPFLLGLPLDLDLSYRQQQVESTPLLLGYVQRFFTGDFYYGLTDAFSIRVGGGLDATIPQNDSLVPCSRRLLNSSTLESTVGILYDTRSNPINPTSGVRYATNVSIGAKKISGPFPCDTSLPARDTRKRYELDLDGYIPVARSLVIAAGVHGGEIQGNLLEESDLFRFGGQSTVRGYREGLIRASRRGWTNLELRLLLSSTSYVAAFFDGGYYRRPDDPIQGTAAFEAWIFGYGAGAQVESPLGLVQVSYALSRDDTFGTGKVFVGLVNQF
jgi:outer membrane protein insertion porin family